MWLCGLVWANGSSLRLDERMYQRDKAIVAKGCEHKYEKQGEIKDVERKSDAISSTNNIDIIITKLWNVYASSMLLAFFSHVCTSMDETQFYVSVLTNLRMWRPEW